MKTTAALAGIFAALTSLGAQNPPAPRPFPGAPPPPPPAEQPAPQPVDAATGDPAAQAAVDPATGVPLYPGSVLLTQYNAGPSQPVYLYGSSSTFANVVEYYKGVLRDRGRQLFDGPMHQFDLGRFRRETMTLQPSVTVKDFTWNGREGYAHANGRELVKYPTVIQIVPAPPER